jgi:hypothetical protein
MALAPLFLNVVSCVLEQPANHVVELVTVHYFAGGVRSTYSVVPLLVSSLESLSHRMEAQNPVSGFRN